MGCNCGCSEDKFDFIYYLNKYADLRKAGINKKCDAYKHFKMHGYKEKRISNINFDYNFYRTYKDLKNFNNEQLWNHWKNHGERENRNFKLL